MFREEILDMGLVYNDDFILYLFINDKTITAVFLVVP